MSVSAPAFWYYRGTRIMRVAHFMVETRPGRLIMRAGGTRISARGWAEPAPGRRPHEAAALLGGIPLLVVHGDVDRYFPLEHPRAIHEAARRSGVRTDLWIEHGLRPRRVGHLDGGPRPHRGLGSGMRRRHRGFRLAT